MNVARSPSAWNVLRNWAFAIAIMTSDGRTPSAESVSGASNAEREGSNLSVFLS